MNYIFDGELDNRIHDITYDQIRLMYEDNEREKKESEEVTESTYRGENYYDKYGNTHHAIQMEYLLRDPRTSGKKIYYPHGIIINQSARRNYYRGENQLYSESLPTLQRSLKKYTSIEDKELYRMISDMRIAEFSFLIDKFEHVQSWRISDILYEPLAQHYGLETSWLDITSDFAIALFFATCYWDRGQWRPLKKEQTEIDEQHQYGMIFHMPSYCMSLRWHNAIQNFIPCTENPIGKNSEGKSVYGRLDYPVYKSKMDNLIYPLGFQPFMRCHMQNGYGIYMRTPKPLQEDLEFEKLRFRHSEELSERVFEAMRGGELIYPHEGLKLVDFIIDEIKQMTTFSENAFQYALYRSHYFRMEDSEQVREKLSNFMLNGHAIQISDKSSWKLSSGRKNSMNRLYSDFSIEESYKIKIFERGAGSWVNPMFEPWMIPEENDGNGVKDFRLRESVQCGSLSHNLCKPG